MSLMNKLTKLAKSEKGKELIDKAQAIANDPKNREKLESARGKVEQQIDAAKHKIAEKRGEKGDAPSTPETSATPTPTYGEETSAANTPQYGEESAPTEPKDEPTATGTPAYGEESSDPTPPTYGEDGPKAA
jgi:hypothetical protein